MQPSKRSAKENAASAIVVSNACSTVYKPRGTPEEAGIASGKKRKLDSVDTDETTYVNSQSLCQIVRHNPWLYNKGNNALVNTLRKIQALTYKGICYSVFDHCHGWTGAQCNWCCEVCISSNRPRCWTHLQVLLFTAVGGSQQNIDAEFVSQELSSDRGHGCGNQSYITHDEDFRLQARKFVWSNCSNKGEPNLTALQFRDLIEATLGVSVCNTTATVWLHHLGFSQKNHMKGVFFDGHDGEDVVEYRADFFKSLTRR